MRILIFIVSIFCCNAFATTDSNQKNCESEATPENNAARKVFEEFLAFSQTLPAELRTQIDHFGPTKGFPSKQVMDEELAKGNGPMNFFMIVIYAQPSGEVAFAIDPSLNAPIVRENKVYLPEQIGGYKVQLGILTLH